MKQKRIAISSVHKELLMTLLMYSGVSTGLLLLRIIVSGTGRLVFLQWNLVLAWVPVLLAIWIYGRIQKGVDLTWANGLLALAWLFFLPNSFYIITDLIHLQSSGEVSLLYDTALIASFVLNGILLGFASIFIVRSTAKRFLKPDHVSWLVQAVLFLCAFAIYLGRYLRWNTWDVLLNPAGLLFDVSDRIVNPGTHTHTFVVTGVFFILLSSLYITVDRLVNLVANHARD